MVNNEIFNKRKLILMNVSLVAQLFSYVIIADNQNRQFCVHL